MTRVVAALGGNALLRQGQEGNVHEQFDNARVACRQLAGTVEGGHELIVTHGNGPQVGAIYLQNQLAADVTPPMPLGICVAMSEGFIGYMLQQVLGNALRSRGLDREVVTLITQVVVDEDDPGLEEPTKPVGPYWDEDEAIEMIAEGHQMRKVGDRGWRIVVPSPDPLEIVESDVVARLVEDGTIVVASGGGGMAVTETEEGLEGLEVVVDKDLAAERLATDVGADVLLILTDVDHVYLGYGTDEERPLEAVTAEELWDHYEQGVFPKGSMGPKVQAALRFLARGGDRAVVTSIDEAEAALAGDAGTQIRP